MPTLAFKGGDLIKAMMTLREASIKARSWASALKDPEYSEWDESMSNRLAAMCRAVQQARMKGTKSAVEMLGPAGPQPGTPPAQPADADEEALEAKRRRLSFKQPIQPSVAVLAPPVAEAASSSSQAASSSPAPAAPDLAPVAAEAAPKLPE